MKAILFFASATILYCTCTYFDEYEEVYFRNLRRTDDKELNLNESFFPQLLNYKVEGVEVDESMYPWIAKVIHSTINSGPYLCTAVCIEKNIFISAARCVHILKVLLTSLMYQHQRLTVKALVLPSNPSKQLYDDIGFIITSGKFSGEWETIKLYDKKRTDDSFRWFRDLNFDTYEHIVIGYATIKSLENLPLWHRPVFLVQLDVTVGIDLCSKILSYNNLIQGFAVPCYHSCTYTMFHEGNTTCKSYHGVEGSALVNKKTNLLFGITTWGALSDSCELPVGFSVPNSNSFYEDLDCALKIRNYQGIETEGSYQKLCESKRKYY